jgi:outer membrane lipoprotein SlyB
MSGSKLFLLAALAISACTPQVSPDAYGVGAVGQVNRAIRGVVISARPITIDGTLGVGTTAGATAGAIGGSFVGGDVRSNLIGAVAGAVVGGVAGAAAEQGATRQQGMEYVIQSQNGALLTVVQGSDPSFHVGARVIVLYGNRSRVITDPGTE